MISLLVTVGSTSFPSLTDYICQHQTLQTLYQLGITSITIQYGTHPPKLPSTHSSSLPSITALAYASSLTPLLESSNIVISHAGAGTLLEAAALRKHVVAVVNDTLMDNHQIELAQALAHIGCCYLVKDHLHTKLLSALRHQLDLYSSNQLPSLPPMKQINPILSLISNELRHC